MATEPKRERLEARLTPEHKALIQRASELSGRSVTDFVTATLVDAAWEVVQRHQSLTLTLAESEALAQRLAATPEPNDALRRAWTESGE